MGLLLFLLCASIPPYVRHSLEFPHIPYDVGLRHIHTPEQCVDAYGLLPPGFQILKTLTPIRMGSCDVVQFTFTTILGGVRHASLFSSDVDSSQLLFFNASLKPALLASLRVRPSGRGGHSLLVTGSYLAKPEGVLERLLTRRAVSKKAIHDAIQIGYRGSVGKPEDANLKEYRRRVLALG
jgi:hypothetical protein